MGSTKLLIFIVFLIPLTLGRHVQFYRKDYTYIEDYDAFYKVHWDLNGLSWNSAFFACDDEGATLFYPKAKGEWEVVKNLTNKMSDAPNATEIFVGIHNEFDVGEFITVDGLSTPYPLLEDPKPVVGIDSCILMDINTGLFQIDTCNRMPDTPLPFVCKKLDDESCPTIDRSYKFSSLTRKCYKINNTPKMWKDALQTCFMEGGNLAVVDNFDEAKLLSDMAKQSSTYFVGVRRIFSSSELYSVTGKKINELYQLNYNTNGYNCGVVWKNGDSLYTMTADCGSRLPFICEMDIPTEK